ncbi:hypothetical protein QR685DRAFT_219454 [Neurospora intermedia]|uniref:Secreted protein n=1 Tax=Neurospora intermedia TaxID=5142 RepID=A0ABR3DGW9_NEUIN
MGRKQFLFPFPFSLFFFFFFFFSWFSSKIPIYRRLTGCGYLLFARILSVFAFRLKLSYLSTFLLSRYHLDSVHGHG